MFRFSLRNESPELGEIDRCFNSQWLSYDKTQEIVTQLNHHLTHQVKIAKKKYNINLKAYKLFCCSVRAQGDHFWQKEKDAFLKRFPRFNDAYCSSFVVYFNMTYGVSIDRDKLKITLRIPPLVEFLHDFYSNFFEHEDILSQAFSDGNILQTTFLIISTLRLTFGDMIHSKHCIAKVGYDKLPDKLEQTVIEDDKTIVDHNMFLENDKDETETFFSASKPIRLSDMEKKIEEREGSIISEIEITELMKKMINGTAIEHQSKSIPIPTSHENVKPEGDIEIISNDDTQQNDMFDESQITPNDSLSQINHPIQQNMLSVESFLQNPGITIDEIVNHNNNNQIIDNDNNMSRIESFADGAEDPPMKLD
jgi:hypothetical protein